MPLRRLGISNYHLFWRNEIQESGLETLGKQFLPQFEGDPGAMRDLRALLAESTLDDNRRLTDEQVLVGIGLLLASRELLAVREYPAHGGSATQPGSGASPPPPSSPAPSNSTKSQLPENATFPPDTDGAGQASSLNSASASGAPFCAH